MIRRLPRRARNLCRLAPVGLDCPAFGSESACALCDMIDFDHPTTAVTLGRMPAHDAQGAAEAQFWAHLARRSDGGPTTPAELERKLRRARRRVGVELAAAASAWRHTASDLPVEPPF
jgi:hypothetical protein